MEMMHGFASCLIKVRQHHIGFPSLFSHYPEGMKHEELTEIHEYVQNAMDQPREIPEASGYLRRVIIGTGKYLIMGVAGYAQHLAAEVQNVPHQLVDFTGRGCPGFIGFVWNLEKTPIHQIGFPSLSTFGSVFHELILNHWVDSKNSEWAYQTRAGIETPYKYTVSVEILPMPAETVALNHNKKKTYSFDRSKKNTLIYQAISEATKKQMVSICTDLYFNDEEGSSFLNMTANLKGASHEVLNNAKYSTPKNNTESAPIKTNNLTHGCPTQPGIIITEEPIDSEEYRVDKASNRGAATVRRTLGQFGIDHHTSPNMVYLVILLGSSPKVIDLANHFINLLTTSIVNSHQFKIELVAPDNKAGKFETGVVLPDGFDIVDFENLCRKILLYYNESGAIYVDKDGRCWVNTYYGQEQFHVCVMEKPAWFSKNELLLKETTTTDQKASDNKGNNRIGTKKPKPTKEPTMHTSNDPLIQKIKQNNGGQQAKHRGDDDPFKCFD